MSGQMNQVGSIGVDAGAGSADEQPQHQPMDHMAGLAGMDQQFMLLRTTMRKKIFEYISRKPSPAEWVRRFPTLTRLLEDILYAKFPNKNDYFYMMKGPVEPQLLFALKTLMAQHQNQQKSRQIASSSASVIPDVIYDDLCEQFASLTTDMQ